MKTEKVINFKNTYIQINVNNFGLGIAIDKKGIDILILFLYIGFYSRN